MSFPNHQIRIALLWAHVWHFQEHEEGGGSAEWHRHVHVLLGWQRLFICQDVRYHCCACDEPAPPPPL